MLSISVIITSIDKQGKAMKNPEKTISQAINDYLNIIKSARSIHTALTYRNALNLFLQTLLVHNIDPQSAKVDTINEEAIAWFSADLKVYAAATERLYLTAANGFYEFLSAENLAEVNLPKIHLLIRQRSRKPGQRLPQFPAESIDAIIDAMITLKNQPERTQIEHLRDMRDRAFLITLADTGLRVHEACNLHRGDIDWNEGHAIIIGKGNRQDLVRFSKRSMLALREYLSMRASLDGSSNRPLSSLPLFARHDKGTGQRIKSMTTTTGRNIVTQRVEQILGKEAVGTITPHSFRHYFVTRVLRASGNLKLAQELARHRNITVTQRYAHLNDDELDKGYYQAIEENDK
jgi:integrase/recombinase XerC